MSDAIIRKVYWRRRDPLQGLSPTMLKTLGLFAQGHDALAARVPTMKSSTVRALADRGLLRRRAGARGLGDGFGVTSEGAEVLGEFARRADR